MSQKKKGNVIIKAAACVLFIMLSVGLLWQTDRYFRPREMNIAAFLTPEQQEMLGHFPMNIYEATAQDLMEAEGIGETYAELILVYLEDHPHIHSLKDLEEIKGIGEVRRKALQQIFFVD